jgi:pyruvate dehydrogenase E2 component (dihydrolipoamide acetyltransferase)
MFGVEVFPIINPPEAAILGVGEIRQEPKVVGAAIAIRSMMRLVLSADHRAVDGAYAARFLAQLKQDLERHNLTN